MLIRARQAMKYIPSGATGLVALCLLAPVTQVVAQELQEAEAQTISPSLAADAVEDRGDGIWWEGRVSGRPDSLYLRLHITGIRSAGAGGYRVVIRAANERLITSYGPEMFREGTAFYSDVLYSPAVKIQIQGDRKEGPSPKGLHFEIDSFLSAVDIRGRLTPQSLLPTWRSLDQLPVSLPIRPFVESVAKLYMGDGAICTGFLVGVGMLLTNHHCLAHSTEFRASPAPAPRCGDIKVHFDFNSQARLDQFTSVSCEGVSASSQPLDYALLKLGPEPGKRTAPRRILQLSASTTGPVPSVFMIHHPAGLSLQVSLDCSTFAGVGINEVQHNCSTTSGSSGGPVLTADGVVVALHSDGAYPDNLTIRQLNDLLAKGVVFLNKGRPAPAIRDGLKTFLPSPTPPSK